MADDTETCGPLVAQARDVSRDRFARQAGLPDVRVTEVALAALRTRPLTAQIIVAGADMELIFRAHFDRAFAQAVTAVRHGVPAATPELALDLVREFCNLVSGQLKALLDAAGAPMAQGLPFVYGGDVRAQAGGDGAWTTAAWGLLAPQIGTLGCSLAVAIKSAAARGVLSKVNESAALVPSSGDVELF